MLDFLVRIFSGLIICSLLLNCSLKEETAPSPNIGNYIPSTDDTTVAINSTDADSNKRTNDGTVIWQQESAEGSLIWTTKDVYLNIGNKKDALFGKSFKRFHSAGVKVATANLKSIEFTRESIFSKNKSGLELQSSAGMAIRSVVGSIVTFEVSYMSILHEYPASTDTWWLSLDLSKSGQIKPFSEVDGQNYECRRMVNLGEVFSEKDLLAAVLENSEIKQTLAAQGRETIPRSLNELLENNGKYKDRPRIEVGDDGNFLTDNSFEHFVFDRIENNKIVVRLMVVSFVAVNNSNIDFIEVSLPIPNKYRNQFSLADNQSHGFLGKDSSKIAKGLESSIDLTTFIPIPKVKYAGQD